MRILITGGAGHLGSHLIRKLGQLDCIEEIVVIDNMSTQRFGSFFDLPFKSKINLKVIDVKEISIEDSLFNRAFAAIIHLAAMTDASQSLVAPNQIFQNNLGSTEHLIDLCSKLSIPLIFPSSTSIYYPNPEEVEVDEQSLNLRGSSPYTESKIREEFAINNSRDSLNFCILRLGTIFGVSSGMRFHTAINKFCWQTSVGEEITVWKTALNQVRPYLSIEDFSSAIVHIITNQIFDNQTYNLVTTNVSVLEILDEIQNCTKVDPKIKFIDSELMNSLSYEVSNEKFRLTKFEFEGSLTAEIAKTINLLRGFCGE